MGVHVYLQGVSMSMVGPTLLDLQLLIRATTSHIVYTMAARSLGIVLGSAVCGALYHRVNVWLSLALCWTVAAIVDVTTPWAPLVSLLGALFFVKGIAFGWCDVGML